MKKQSVKIIVLGLLEAALILFTAFFQSSPGQTLNDPLLPGHEASLQQKAFKILETKCNSCHRRQNPFMVFKEKNLTKRAAKIYVQVFVKKRMPKAEGEPLTSSEYELLRAWLATKI